jgi:taurine dioxygenase
LTALSLEPVAGALGALVRGVRLHDALEPAVIEALQAALVEHQVLFFRDQTLDPGALVRLGRRFGALSAHPAYPHPAHPEVAVLEHTAQRPSKIELWHTDMTFLAQPPLGSILCADVVPAAGGDTWFASSWAAFDALSEPMRQMLDGLTAEHSFAHGFKESLAEAEPDDPLWAAVRANPPRRHPVIRRHPVNGRPGLFVNRLFTTRIVELTPSESSTLLEYLWRHATTPEFTCRFRWRPGSVAFWDNRSTLHRPTNDYGFTHRRMHRVTVEGDAPR